MSNPLNTLIVSLLATANLLNYKTMPLTQKAVTRFKAMSEEDILAYAVKLHKQQEKEISADVINFPLKKDIEQLHLFMYRNVPAHLFRKYVKHVSDTLNRPNWMAGMLGVPYNFGGGDSLT